MQKIPRWLTAIFVSVFLAPAIGGAWFYRVQEQNLRSVAETHLEAIAQLKVNQIVQWRNDCRDDASVLMESPFLLEGILRWMAVPRTVSSKDLLTRFHSLQRHYRYSDVLLAGVGGEVLLSLSGRTGPLNERTAQDVAVSIREQRPVLSEILAGPSDLTPHLYVIAPFFTRNTEGSRPVGAILLRCDARQFLYPMVQSWPTPSASAETVLVRRSGDSALIMNKPRFMQGAAFNLRTPLSRKNVPAVMAVQGRLGLVEGKDYRGIEVLAVLKHIPDSQWFMVAKIDAAEALAVWRARSTLIIVLIFGLMAAATASAGFVWQHYAKAHYRQLFLAEAARRVAEERYRTTLLCIGDGVITTDARGFTTLLNPVAEALTGWRHEEARGKSISEVFRIINEETRQTVENPVERVLSEGIVVGLANHTVLIARDGKEYPIADSGAPIRDETGEIVGTVLVFRDHTEARRVEEELRTALQEREVLLREVHHRVKNNLQVISGLLDIQADGADENLRWAFQDTKTRIRSMAAIHEQLTHRANLARVDMAGYIRELVKSVLATYGGGSISARVNVSDITLPFDAVSPCGLLINELVSNAVRHSFPQGWNEARPHESCEISISLRKLPTDDGRFELSVADNGVGLPESLKIEEASSLGLTLINLLVRQLQGELAVTRAVGTSFRIVFGPLRVARRI